MRRRRRRRTSLTRRRVARFLALTHDQYYEHLREFFGTTVIALFTDEPSIFGQGAAPEPRPRSRTRPASWTGWRRGGRDGGGDDPRAVAAGAVAPTMGTRRQRSAATTPAGVQQRLEEVFYAAQSEWVRGTRHCADGASQVEQ